MTSSLAPVPAGLFNYDANDRFTVGDTYDANGNTITAGGVANVYDFENHLIQKDGVSLKYDGDGNRIFKTVAGVTTGYLLDDRSPTGYVQVLDEVQGPFISRSYVYGLELIEQDRIANSRQSTSYNVYDGHGSVRALTDLTGAVTDTYDYDGFGNLIHSTGTTPNNYLFAGEQFDPDLNLYYNRARYLNVSTGRFWSMDFLEGDAGAPQSLHKYLYAEGNPIDQFDPSGNQASVAEVTTESTIGQILDTGLSAVNTGFKVLNFAQRVQHIVNYVDLAVKMVQAIDGQPTPAGFGNAVEIAIKTVIPEFDPSNFSIGFQAAFAVLQKDWAKIQKAISSKIPEIAAAAAAASASHLEGFAAAEARGTLKYIIFSPTGPGGRSGDQFIDIGTTYS